MSPAPSPGEPRGFAETSIGADDESEWMPAEWEVAFHEAGHVVVQVDGGFYPDVVYLNDDDLAGDDHVGRVEDRSFLVVFAAPGEDGTAARSATERRRVYGAMLAAGGLATELALGRAPDEHDRVRRVLADDDDDETDTKKLRHLVAGMTMVQAEAWLHDVHQEAERILDRRWDDVQLVAEMLVIRRRLTRDDLRRLLPSGPPAGP